MNWEAIAAVGQLVGAIAVLVTLIYLAIQMKQNTAAVATSTYESTMSGFNDINIVVASTPGLASIINRGCMSTNELTDIETIQFNFILRCYANQWWKLFKLYERGSLEHTEWPNFAKEAAQFLEQPGCKPFCEQNNLFSELYEELEKYKSGVISNFGFTDQMAKNEKLM